MPARGGCVLPVARLGRLGWYVEGDGWTMQPRASGAPLTLADEKRICVAAAAALRVPISEIDDRGEAIAS